MTREPRGPHEFESTLIVWSDRSAATARRLSTVREIDRYKLTPEPDQYIEDLYLDTADGQLSAKRLSLRIRRLNDEPRLTLKGPSRGKGPGTSRLEIERPWSISAARSMLKLLRDLDVTLDSRAAATATWAGPEEFAARVGLVELQRRSTLRQPRSVRRLDSDNNPLAEYAVDTVTYRLRRRRLRLCEIEIEAKRASGRKAVARLHDALLREYPITLRHWRHSKLALGIALQELETEGRLARWIKTGGWLSRRGLEQVSKELERSSAEKDHLARR
jgi:inorganic triphosphatase YgiF